MPKQVVYKKDVVEAAMKLTRTKGYKSVNARSVAEAIGCSVQPIYSCYKNMSELKSELYGRAMAEYNKFIYARIDADEYMLSMAKANVDFAREETNLFRFLFFTKMAGIESFDSIYEKMADKEIARKLAQRSKLSESKIKEMYIMMIVFTHGIASMLAASEIKLTDDDILAYLRKAYAAFMNV